MEYKIELTIGKINFKLFLFYLKGTNSSDLNKIYKLNANFSNELGIILNNLYGFPIVNFHYDKSKLLTNPI